jgi:hypothetical protein
MRRTRLIWGENPDSFNTGILERACSVIQNSCSSPAALQSLIKPKVQWLSSVTPISLQAIKIYLQIQNKE